GQQPVGHEGPGQDAQPPGRHQQARSPVAAVEGAGGHERQHADRPAADPEAELGGQQGGHHRVAAGVADGLDRVGHRPDPPAGTVPWAMKAKATGPWRATRNSPAAPAWSSEITIISPRRSIRSAAGPASGLSRKMGSDWTTSTAAPAKFDPVRSMTRPSMA